MKLKEEDLKRELGLVLSGKSSCSFCARVLGVNIRTVERLAARARLHGVDAVLHSNRPRKHENSFKLEVVQSIINEVQTKSSAAVVYNLNESTVSCWLNKYIKGGEAGLLEDTRGRKNMGRKKKPRLEDFEPGSIEYIKLENELLKRENALLKKALPLVQEKIKRRSHVKSDTSSSMN